MYLHHTHKFYAPPPGPDSSAWRPANPLGRTKPLAALQADRILRLGCLIVRWNCCCLVVEMLGVEGDVTKNITC